jgi:hypothetical protein
MLDARGEKKEVRSQRLEGALLGKVDGEKIVYCFDKKMISIERHDEGTR